MLIATGMTLFAGLLSEHSELVYTHTHTHTHTHTPISIRQSYFEKSAFKGEQRNGDGSWERGLEMRSAKACLLEWKILEHVYMLVRTI